MKTLALIGVALAVVSCGPSLIVLKNPQTGEMAQCQADGTMAAPGRIAARCAEAYEKNGWVRQ